MSIVLLYDFSSVWSNTTDKNIRKLQSVQNFAAHVVSYTKRYNHVTPVLKSRRASSYEPGNRAGLLGGTNFFFCAYENFNPGYRDENCPKSIENTRGTAFRLVSDLKSHAQLKMFRRGIRAGVFIWENFQLGYRDLGNRASPPSHMDTLKFL